MNINNNTPSLISSRVQTATIVLEVAGGSRVAFSAYQPSGAEQASLSYRWHADHAAVISPNEVNTDILMPQVAAATLANITLTVTNHRGDIAQRSWPVCVMPSDHGAESDNQEPLPQYPLWNASSTYPGQSRVSHKGANYQAKWWIVAGVEPGLPGTTGPASGNALPWMQI
ncbi:hypothetical protein [Erwinia psidii]|uniref:hypothetical protein n=1 Tax=Erwinia psidii TaxID=69224 RepID=UPI0013151CE4|nr:hypothetical protein [Erwinia psidii]